MHHGLVRTRIDFQMKSQQPLITIEIIKVVCTSIPSDSAGNCTIDSVRKKNGYVMDSADIPSTNRMENQIFIIGSRIFMY